jgi:hypothetical protein
MMDEERKGKKKKKGTKEKKRRKKISPQGSRRRGRRRTKEERRALFSAGAVEETREGGTSKMDERGLGDALAPQRLATAGALLLVNTAAGLAQQLLEVRIPRPDIADIGLVSPNLCSFPSSFALLSSSSSAVVLQLGIGSTMAGLLRAAALSLLLLAPALHAAPSSLLLRRRDDAPAVARVPNAVKAGITLVDPAAQCGSAIPPDQTAQFAAELDFHNETVARLGLAAGGIAIGVYRSDKRVCSRFSFPEAGGSFEFFTLDTVGSTNVT